MWARYSDNACYFLLYRFLSRPLYPLFTRSPHPGLAACLCLPFFVLIPPDVMFPTYASSFMGWYRSHGLPALSRVWHTLYLRARPWYSLVVDGDVKKTNQPKKQTNPSSWHGKALLETLTCVSRFSGTFYPGLNWRAGILSLDTWPSCPFLAGGVKEWVLSSGDFWWSFL